jgi:hypothetical protein
VVYTEQEKIVGTYNAGVTNGRKGFGALGNAWSGNVLYAWMRPGAAAEMSDAAIKAEMQALAQQFRGADLCRTCQQRNSHRPGSGSRTA